MLYPALHSWLVVPKGETRDANTEEPLDKLYWDRLPLFQSGDIEIAAIPSFGELPERIFGSPETGGILRYNAGVRFEARVLPNHAVLADELLQQVKRRLLQLCSGEYAGHPLSGEGKYLPADDWEQPDDMILRIHKSDGVAVEKFSDDPSAFQEYIWFVELTQDITFLEQDREQRRIASMAVQIDHYPAFL